MGGKSGNTTRADFYALICFLILGGLCVSFLYAGLLNCDSRCLFYACFTREAHASEAAVQDAETNPESQQQGFSTALLEGSQVSGITLPQHTYAPFVQHTPVTDIFDRVHAGELVRQSDLYAYNDRTITNRNVLFLQSMDALTISDYHEYSLCAPIARFTEGSLDKLYGYEAFVDALTNGHTLCEYGTVVINTHGSGHEDSYDDGTSRVWIMAAGGSGDNSESKFFVPNSFVYDFAQKYGYEVESTQDSNGERLLIKDRMLRRGDGALWITTQLIMERYENSVFDNTVFYFGICECYRDQAFRSFLMDHGAQFLIGWYQSNWNFVDLYYCEYLGNNWIKADIPSDDVIESLHTRIAPKPVHTKRLNYALEEAIYSEIAPFNSAFAARPYWYARTNDFVYWGHGSMSAYVKDAQGNPVFGAEVGVWRLVNKNFEPYGTTTTGEDGSFEFKDMEWGTFVAYVTTPDGRHATAQANHGDEDSQLGTIVIEDGLAPAASQPETPQEIPLSEQDALEQTYQQLILKYGQVKQGPDLYPTSEADASECIGRLRDDLNGIAGHVINDINGDEHLELLVVRYEPAEVYDEYSGTADGTKIVIELYAYDDGHQVTPVSDLEFTTKSFALSYHDIRTAVFLSPATHFGSTGYVLNIVVSNSVNDNLEMTRQYIFEGYTPILVGAASFWRADEWYSAYRGDISCSGINDAAPLVKYTAGDGYGWFMTQHAEIDESYSEQAYTDFNTLLAAGFWDYQNALVQTGLARNGHSFWYTDLYDFLDETKHHISELFDNAGDFIWVSDVMCSSTYTTGESTKYFLATYL